MSRPSHKELSNKISQAKTAVENENIQLLNLPALLSDADELNYVIDEQLEDLLLELLNRSSPVNYVGARPPQKSYQQVVHGAELFAFVVEETSLNEPIYYKFSIVGGIVYIVSLHRDRKEWRS